MFTPHCCCEDKSELIHVRCLGQGLAHNPVLPCLLQAQLCSGLKDRMVPKYLPSGRTSEQTGCQSVGQSHGPLAHTRSWGPALASPVWAGPALPPAAWERPALPALGCVSDRPAVCLTGRGRGSQGVHWRVSLPGLCSPLERRAAGPIRTAGGTWGLSRGHRCLRWVGCVPGEGLGARGPKPGVGSVLEMVLF